MKDPNAPAGKRQKGALWGRTGVDVAHIGLTKRQAGELLDLVSDGHRELVRRELIERGGVPSGELQGPNEVRVLKNLGRTMLGLPDGVEVPSDVEVTVEWTAEGHLLIKW